MSYNGRVPTAPGRPSLRSTLVRWAVVVMVVGGLNALGVYAEGQADTPTDDACAAMVNYHRSLLSGRSNSDARDRLRYLEGRLHKAEAPEAVVIREYLAYDRVYGASGEVRIVVDPETGAAGLAAEESMGQRLLRRAAQACTDLGHSGLQQSLDSEVAPPQPDADRR
jgi:hypothetical protein